MGAAVSGNRLHRSHVGAADRRVGARHGKRVVVPSRMPMITRATGNAACTASGMRSRTLGSYLAFGAATVAAGLMGAFATRRSVDSFWYHVELKKPSFQPPEKVFGPVWTVLYGLIAVSGARVWQARRSRARTRALALWGTQLALNTAWPLIFFGARRPRAALADLVALIGSIAAYMDEAQQVDGRAAIAVAPYLAWTGFATLLNEEIVRLNA